MFRFTNLILVSLLTIAGLWDFTCVGQATQIPDDNEKTAIESRLELAGNNRGELEKALESAPKEHQSAIQFLIMNMPRVDLESLSSEFLMENVRLAFEARAKAKWAGQVPDEVFFNDILPYSHVDETREPWRAKLAEICWPIVKDCETTGEAAQALNKNLFQLVQVKYSTKRKKANQSPSESMEQGLASCTGLSILLADACRSVHVPARLAGIPSWTNKRGNHTWVEVWSDNDWHFTGAAEYSAAGLDRAWFTGDAALADKTKRLNSIYAVSFAKTDTTFPMVWSRDPENAIYAVNVTDRYTAGAEPKTVEQNKIRVRFRVWNQEKSERIATSVAILDNSGKALDGFNGTSPTNTADMNDMLEFVLKRETKYQVQIGEGESKEVYELQTGTGETQLVEFRLKK